jgi:8-oxo-dGTP pyrophosphatase MutT (NUDIX family)
MKLLKEIYQKDIGEKNGVDIKYVIRKAGRAVVFDDEGNVAVLHVQKGDYWKIPGGGVKDGESVIIGTEREVEEEAGVDITIKDEIGEIIEYRDSWEQKQISYCFLATVTGKKNDPKYTQKEREEGFTLHWLPYEEALEKFKNSLSLGYEAKFMQTRDGIFLREAKKIIEK